MTRKISLLKLFLIFFKIGLVLFGGGYAMLPFLRAEIVEKEKICTMEDITNYYAISQCIPGLVAGNVSMLLGYKARGVAGAFFSVFGVCLPAFLAIVLIFTFLSMIMGGTVVNNVFYVLDIAVCVLIFLTVLELMRFSIIDRFSAFIFVVALASAFLKISPFIIILVAGMMGIMRCFFNPCDLGCVINSKEENIE